MSWLAVLADFYTPERALAWTRWNALAWSIADILLCVFLLDLTDRARRVEGRCRARLRWSLFAVSVLLTPALFVASSQQAIFREEAIICGLQFLVLAGTAVLDARLLLRMHARYFDSGASASALQ